MYKITNIDTLGTIFNVADSKGRFVDTVQLIPQSEILAAAGEYVDGTDIKEYLEKAVKMLEGSNLVDHTSVLWYTTTEEEVVIADIIEYSVEHGYSTVILEYLDNDE
jgi:hypothetical protein